MKKFLVILLSFLFLFAFVASIQAHFRGQPFVKIDGNPTQIYTVNEYSTINDEPIPSDFAKGTFLVNKKIDFEIDPTVLPFPEEIAKDVKYKWNFGDGTKATGEKTSHKYTKFGSYVVRVDIEYGDLSKYGLDSTSIPPTYQLILLNVLQDKEYKLPKPSITIDGKKIQDYQVKENGKVIATSPAFIELYNHLLGLRIVKDIKFNAEGSAGSSKIKSFLWDFEDGESILHSSKVSHSFKKDFYLNNVALKVEDEKGFVAYLLIGVGNKDMQDITESGEKDKSPILDSKVIYIVPVMVLLVAVAIFLVKIKRS